MASGSDDTLGQRLFKRAERLRSRRREVFDSQVQQIYQYFWPDLSDVNTEKTEDTSDWFDRIFNSIPIEASRTCSVGVRNWVTPSTEPWLDLSPPYNLLKAGQPGPTNPRLARLSTPQAPAVDDNGQDEATRWCGEVASQTLNWLSESNFYSVIQPFNRAACTAGTALMFMEEGKAATFNFEQFKFGTFCIAENEEKLVDTVFRWFKLTVRQAMQRFGKDGLPAPMKKAIESEKWDEEYTFIHCVYPNDEMRQGAIGPEGMAFASVYLSVIEKKVVSQGGYEEMPYFCLRWSRWGTENQVWGCSPAYECLADAREVNRVTEFGHALVELKAFPRGFYPDSLDGNVEMAPGAWTVVKADDLARGVKPEEWPTKGSDEELLALIDRMEKAINRTFFVDVFKALSQLEDKITESTYGAVALLQGEKLDQFTGTFDQYRTELINPLVRRAIGIAYRGGLLKDPPQSLMVRPGNDPKADPQLASPKINIKSRVTVAMGQFKNQGLQKTLETWAPMMEAHPDIWDNLDADSAFRRSGLDNGQPPADFRPLKAVMALRDQRAKMQKQEQALHAAEIGGKAAGALGKAPQKLQNAIGDQITGADEQPNAA